MRMEDTKKNKESNRLYTVHGKKRTQGKLTIINGKKALAYFEGTTIVGYTTLDEMMQEFYTRNLPQYTLNF